MIVIWGTEYGQCLIQYGTYTKGFRQLFDNAKEADYFIKMQCNKIPRDEIQHYGMYITDEYKSLDDVLHYHNLKQTDNAYRTRDSKIEEVDIHEIKNHIDLMYQLEQKKFIDDKLQVDKAIRNMTAEDKRYQTEMFKKLNVMI